MTTRTAGIDSRRGMDLASLNSPGKTAPALRLKWMEFEEASVGIGIGSDTRLQRVILPHTVSGTPEKSIKGIVDYRIAF